MANFTVRKFYAYRSPNHYLDRQALVFNLSIAPDTPPTSRFRDAVVARFPRLDEDFPDRIEELYARALVQALKMDIDLYLDRYSLSRDAEEHVVAVEFLDDRVAEECVSFVSGWFEAIAEDGSFDFDSQWAELQADFDRTLFGGPTLYSLIEAGIKRGIPILYLYEENVFMWGYGRKQMRGRSTTFHVDSIKDTEFTTFKDMCKDFLLMCGFPTPAGGNCYTVEDALDEAAKQGFPVVVKPVAGHKGQGVTTNVASDAQVREAFRKIEAAAAAEGVGFDGAIVEKQIYGTDHRLLAVGGKFAAALERVPAYVDGNGRDTIEELIARENDTVVRLDNARSPLCKIKIDDDLEEYLGLQDLSLRSVPKDGERILLRRVANISAGGVSINVTDKIHPKNVKLVEDIAKYFKVVCLGIDVLAKDISRPWTEGDFGIIEINAGPGVFMHLAPAIGESIDVPGKVMQALFPDGHRGRIPIVAGNRIPKSLADGIYAAVEQVRPGIELGSLTDEGVSFNGELFHRNDSHHKNGIILLRNPQLDFALFQHTRHDLYDFGTVHQGADVVFLDDPAPVERETLCRDLLPGGSLVEVEDRKLTVTRDGQLVQQRELPGSADARARVVLEVLAELAREIVNRYH